jgi:hypothetical protein
MADDIKPWEQYSSAPTVGEESKPWEQYASSEGKNPWEMYASENPKIEEPATQETKTTNPFMGFAARASDLAGNTVEGIARVGEHIGDYLEKVMPISGVSEEDLKNKQQLQPLFDFAKSLKDWSKEVGYAPSTTLGELPGNPLKYIPFFVERFISSAPDMLASSSPAYVIGLTNETLNDRLKNDNKSLEDATIGDIAISTVSSMLQTKLENLAKGALFKGEHITGATALSRIGKQGLFQFGTEGAEGAVGYLGGTLGTQKGVDPKELLLQSLEEGLVGAGVGKTAQAGKELYNKYAQPTVNPPPPGPQVESAAGTPIPTMPLDTAEKQEQTEAKTPINTDIVLPKDAKTAIAARAKELEVEQNLPRDLAAAVANDEFERGELNVTRPPARVDTGTSEPSVSVPSEGGTTTEGITPLSTERLASVSGPAGRVDEGEGLQPSALERLKKAQEELDDANQANHEALANLQYGESKQEQAKNQIEVNKTRQNKPTTAPVEITPVNLIQAKVQEAQAELQAAEEQVVNAPKNPEAQKIAISRRTRARQALQQAVVKAENVGVEVPETALEAVGKKRGRPAKEQVVGEEPKIETPKGTPGRVVTEKTPEQIALDKKIKAEQDLLRQRDLNQIRTQVNTLETDEATDEQRANALEVLHQLSTSNQPSVANKAKEALAHPTVADEERAYAADQLTTKRRKGEPTALDTSRKQFLADKEVREKEKVDKAARQVAWAEKNSPEDKEARAAAKAQEQADKAAKTAQRKADQAAARAEKQATKEAKKAAAAAAKAAKEASMTAEEKQKAAERKTKIKEGKAKAKKLAAQPVQEAKEGPVVSTREAKEAYKAQKVADLLEAKRARTDEEIFADEPEILAEIAEEKKQLKIDEDNAKNKKEYEKRRAPIEAIERTTGAYLSDEVIDYQNVTEAGIKERDEGHWAAMLDSQESAFQDRMNDYEAKQAKNKTTEGLSTRENAPTDRLSIASKLIELARGAVLAKFKTATVAIDHIVKTGNAFEKVLAQRLKPFLKDVNYIVAQSEADLPDISLRDGQSLKDKFKDANGIYFTTEDGKKYLILRGDKFEGGGGLTFKTFLHEAVHGATIEQIAEYERAVADKRPVDPRLERLIYELKDIVNETATAYTEAKMMGQETPAALDRLFSARKKGGVGILDDLKEFVAYGMTEPDVQEFLANTQGKAKQGAPGFFKNLFTKFVRALSSAFGIPEGSVNAFQDLMLVTEGLMQYKPQMSEETIAKEEKDLSNTKDPASVFNATEKLKGERDVPTMLEQMDKSLDRIPSSVLGKILFNLNTPDIMHWIRKRDPGIAGGLQAANVSVEKMNGLRQNILTSANKIAENLSDLASKHKTLMQKLHMATSQARLNNFSPAAHANLNDALKNDTQIVKLNERVNAADSSDLVKKNALKAIADREKAIREVYTHWDALGQIPGAQQAYKSMREFYKTMFSMRRHLLDKKIKALDIPAEDRQKLISDIKKEFERSLPEEYFPFMRHGDYWFEMKDPKQGRIVKAFDSEKERAKYVKAKLKELGVSREELFQSYAAKEDNDSNRVEKDIQTSSNLLKGVFSSIDGVLQGAKTKEGNVGVSEAKLKELKDDIYQFWLTTGPEASIRRQFIHADNVPGFSEDVLRNFSVYSTRIANDIAKLGYGDEIYSNIERARDSLKGDPMQGKLGMFVNEIEARALEELNPPQETWAGKIANKIGSFGYYFTMTGISSAITQSLSIPTVVLPALGGRYGEIKAAKELGKYTALITKNSLVGAVSSTAKGDLKFTTPSIGDADVIKNDPIRKEAYQQFKDRGAITDTFTRAITQRGKVKSEIYNNSLRKSSRFIANVMSAAFNASEQVSREITLMSAFDLEYAKTGNIDQAVQSAIDQTRQYLSSNESFSRARSFKNPAAKVILQFKQYPITMASLLARNAFAIINKNSSGIERAQAAKTLGGILLMTGLFAGVEGLPLYDLLTDLLDAYWDWSPTDEDRFARGKRRAKNWYASDSSKEWFEREWLPDTFGANSFITRSLQKGLLSEMTGMNIGSHVGLNGLLIRSFESGDTFKDTVWNFLKANAMPAGQRGASFLDGVQQLTDGDVLKGLSNLTPPLVRNFVTATRLATEGEKTKTGVLLKPSEFTASDIVSQALGFQPTKLTRAKDVNRLVASEEHKAKVSSAEVHKKITDALEHGSSSEMQKAINLLRQHDQRYFGSTHYIDPDMVSETLDKILSGNMIVYQGQKINMDKLDKMAPLIRMLQRATSK